MEFWLLLSLGLTGAVLWGALILPALLVGAWLARRVRAHAAASDTSSERGGKVE